MMAILRNLWKWSWLLTLPMSLIFAYWLVALISAYSTFQLRFEPSAPFGLHMEGRNLASYLLRDASFLLGSGKPPAGMPVIELTLASSEHAKLDARLPHSGNTYVPGQLWREGGATAVELRYRGDFMPHWAFPKKSWRVKTLKDEAFAGMRRFNLIAPKFRSQLSTHMGYRLASTMGLLAPRSEQAFLRINGENRGLHLLVEQPDASTLLRHGRPIGDLYSGDLVGSDAYGGISNKVFDHPGTWEKLINDPEIDPDDRSSLENLCRIVNSYPSEAVHAELSGILDMSAFGRFAAFELLIQIFHTGSHHNWRLYLNPESERFEPMVWDSNAWGGFEFLRGNPPVSLDPNITRLHNMLLSNGDFLRAREAALLSFFGAGQAEAFMTELHQAVTQTRSAVAVDPIVRPPDPRIINLILDALPGHVQTIFDKIEAAYITAESQLSYSRRSDDRFHLRLEGRAGMQALQMRFSGTMPSTPRVFLSYRRHGQEHVREISDRAVFSEGLVSIDLPLCSQLLSRPGFEQGFLPNLSQRVLATDYELTIRGLTGINDLLGMKFEQNSIMRPASPASLPELLPLNRLYQILPN